jgi:hypothetical protein
VCVCVCHQSYDRVTFTAGAHEPAVVPTSNLLPVLNEALTTSSAWVQAFAYAHKSTIVHIPFPVRPPPEDLTGIATYSLYSRS